MKGDQRMSEAVSVLLLAGGRSRRMGQDKVWMMLDGQPLIERAARRVLPLAGEIIFSSNEPDRFAALMARLPAPARVIADLYPGAGPLAGLQAGLSVARYELTLALAADMPFVNLDVVRHLLDRSGGYDVVMPSLSPHEAMQPIREPLHSLYRRTCLPAMIERLEAHDYQAFSFLPAVRTRYVHVDEIRAIDPNLWSFFNVNTPLDWQRAQEQAAQAP